MTQQERNREIALMLGFKYKNQSKYWAKYPLDDNSFFSNLGYVMMNNLKFHSDWNWLMEAVEFIGKLKVNSRYASDYNVVSDLFGCTIETTGYEQKTIINILSYDRKEAVFIAVSDFAKYWNDLEK